MAAFWPGPLTLVLPAHAPVSRSITAGQDSVAWFNDFAPHLKSMVQIPLRNASGACFGLMVLASEDPYRFYPDLGTLYLERIADLASAAFLRVLNG